MCDVARERARAQEQERMSDIDTRNVSIGKFKLHANERAKPFETHLLRWGFTRRTSEHFPNEHNDGDERLCVTSARAPSITHCKRSSGRNVRVVVLGWGYKRQTNACFQMNKQQPTRMRKCQDSLSLRVFHIFGRICVTSARAPSILELFRVESSTSGRNHSRPIF